MPRCARSRSRSTRCSPNATRAKRNWSSQGPAWGTKFEDLVRHVRSHGQHPGAVRREEEWLAERLAKHNLPESTHEQPLAGDRWLRVEERRMADGGTIGIWVDITDLKRREASFRLLFDSNPLPM